MLSSFSLSFFSLIISAALWPKANVQVVNHSSCDSNSIYYYPSANNIALNSHIFILANGKASAEKLSRLITSKAEFSLQSGDQRIGLLPEQFHQGFQFCEVLLKPAQLLAPGKLYTLRVMDVAGNNIALPKKAGRKLQWRVTLPEDHKPPILNKQPLPEVLRIQPQLQNVIINIQADDNHDATLLAEVTIKTKGFLNSRKRAKRLLIPIEQQDIAIGYNSCFGTFHFRKGKKYQLHFTVMDICGNRAELKGWLPLKLAANSLKNN